MQVNCIFSFLRPANPYTDSFESQCTEIRPRLYHCLQKALWQSHISTQSYFCRGSYAVPKSNFIKLVFAAKKKERKMPVCVSSLMKEQKIIIFYQKSSKFVCKLNPVSTMQILIGLTLALSRLSYLRQMKMYFSYKIICEQTDRYCARRVKLSKICQHRNNAGSYMDQELTGIVLAQYRRHNNQISVLNNIY